VAGVVEVEEEQVFVDGGHEVVVGALTENLPQQGFACHFRRLEPVEVAVGREVVPFLYPPFRQVFEQQQLDDQVQLFGRDALAVQQLWV
jgi:hypothetical protein